MDDETSEIGSFDEGMRMIFNDWRCSIPGCSAIIVADDLE